MDECGFNQRIPHGPCGSFKLPQYFWTRIHFIFASRVHVFPMLDTGCQLLFAWNRLLCPSRFGTGGGAARR
jgi:hypothetical protein